MWTRIRDLSYQVAMNVSGLLDEQLVQSSLYLLRDSFHSVKFNGCVFHLKYVLFFDGKAADESCMRHCSGVVNIHCSYCVVCCYGNRAFKCQWGARDFRDTSSGALSFLAARACDEQ